MNIKIKRLSENSVIPNYANPCDAGMDLTAISAEYNKENQTYTYGTGIACSIPEGYVGLLFPRSSISKYDLQLTNCVGVVDSGYIGEIKFKFKPTAGSPKVYDIGERVGQLIVIPFPKIEWQEVEELEETERGTGGFGSSGL